MSQVNPRLIDEVAQSGRFDATACLQCGVCAAVCPMGTDLLPRKLFRYVLIGLEDKVVEHHETIFSCLLCGMCEASCPYEVHITENVRQLRSYINRNVYKIQTAQPIQASQGV